MRIVCLSDGPAMNVELEKQLCRDFPFTYAALAKRRIYDLEELLGTNLRGVELVTAFGVEHGDGWYSIVREFAEVAEPWCRKTGSHVVQQKEKYGALVIYMRSESEEVSEAIARAEAASENTCEECGAPAKLEESKSGWWSTVCADCGSQAMRYLNRRAGVERLLHYIFEPRLKPEEVEAWREHMLRAIGAPDVE
jgi:RNA polymerase-binding transcription factor DksA